MKPPQDSSRRCLPLSEWPVPDQRLWTSAFTSADPLSLEHSRAATWRPVTVEKCRVGYGRWLNFLLVSKIGWRGLPAERVTTENVITYVQVLKGQSVAPYTVCSYIYDLLVVMLVFGPDRDWSWLKAVYRKLETEAKDYADKSFPKLLTFNVIERVERKLTAIPTPAIDWREAITFRNWLMLGLLAAVPLRLGNFTRLSIRHQMRKRSGVWSIDIDGAETKTGRPIATVVPPTLGAFVDRYLANVRPLLDRQGNDRLWIGRSGMPIATKSVFEIIKKLTRREFGLAINPHQFRRIFATSLCLSDLDAIEGARAALGHSSARTTRDYYARATALAGSRRHQSLLQKLRVSMKP